MKRSITEIKNAEALEYARYTVFNRVIPSVMDGFKPVQRFFFHSTILNAGNEFKKVSGVGGVVSEYGYAHGEGSCQSAGQLMAATWNNNLCVIEGSGSFGTRMVREAAAARYTKVRLSQITAALFNDSSFAPEHPDVDHTPPKFYLPLIPLLLVNGSYGIAVGYRQETLPRCPIELTQAIIAYVSDRRVKMNVSIHFPEFRGTSYLSEITDNGGVYVVEGDVTWEKNRLIVQEIPPSYDRNKYVAHLDKLVEKKLIRDYEDESSENFRYVIRPVIGYEFDYDDAMTLLNLREKYHENILAISTDDKLVSYQNEWEVIEEFVDYRLYVIEQRRLHNLAVNSYELDKAKAQSKFIQLLLDGGVNEISKMTKIQVESWIEYYITKDPDIIKLLVNTKIFDLTTDMYEQLQNKITNLLNKIEYWKTITADKLYVEDLVNLLNKLK